MDNPNVYLIKQTVMIEITAHSEESALQQARQAVYECDICNEVKYNYEPDVVAINGEYV